MAALEGGTVSCEQGTSVRTCCNDDTHDPPDHGIHPIGAVPLHYQHLSCVAFRIHLPASPRTEYLDRITFVLCSNWTQPVARRYDPELIESRPLALPTPLPVWIQDSDDAEHAGARPPYFKQSVF